MTDLRKRVERRMVEESRFDPDRGVERGRPRRVVVALLPGDVIEFRQERSRRRYTAPLAKVFASVVWWNAKGAKP